MRGKKAKALRKLLRPMVNRMPQKTITVKTKRQEFHRGRMEIVNDFHEVKVDGYHAIKRAYLRRQRTKGMVGKPKSKRRCQK